MTYKAEMKEYLQAKKMPADEGTYPDELMAQITIKAFDELLENIQELNKYLEASDNELVTCERKLENLQDIFKQMQDLITP